MGEITIRQMRAGDVDAAHAIFQTAFGTQLSVADPESYRADSGMIKTRWQRAPELAFVAERAGRIVGSNFITIWGSHGFFGPLTVSPDAWGLGIAGKLLERTLPIFADHTIRHVGLYTFANSPKHLELYRKFGFWPRFLTAIMQHEVTPVDFPLGVSLYSDLSANLQADMLKDCAGLTGQIYAGLNVESEISAVQTQKLGDTILLRKQDRLMGFAVCHSGSGTEAGTTKAYVKFAAIRPASNASALLGELLRATHAFAHTKGAKTLEVGTNLEREESYKLLISKGFRIAQQGVAMHLHNQAGYNNSDTLILDDWR